jgi:prolyl-tRNA synthetase
MKATCLDSNGKAALMPMGCYGVGVSRIVAAAIEQNNDARGIIWPDTIAPFQLVITPIGYQKSEQVKKVCDELYTQLTSVGIEVLLDDRKERPGIMFADADLMGIPHRVVVGEKSLDKGQIEYKNRRADAAEDIAEDTILDFLKTTLSTNRPAA